MKILKLSNKKLLSILFSLFLALNSFAEDQPTDIWNVEKTTDEKTKPEIENLENKIKSKDISESDIYKMQTEKNSEMIEFDENLTTKKTKIIGLYDPEDYGLDIEMWSYSDGNQLKNIFSRLKKIELSDDAKEIMNIVMLINAYPPQKNISNKEFLKFRSDWLIKNSDLNLIENYLIKNQIIDVHPKLTRYVIDEYLSNANINSACEIFTKNSEPIKDKYLSKFNIYCLIKNNKKEEAQVILDLKKELGFKDKYFEKKINYLLEYTTEIDKSISENSILEFHLAHQTNPNFSFEPNQTTKKIIWKYLSSSNLLNSFQEINTSDYKKISILEKAVHNKNYPEIDLLNIYKRFQFNINQLLNAEKVYMSLTNIEARALIYQKILLESEMIEKLKLLKILKSLFKKDNLTDAFDVELKNFLNVMDPLQIPDNLTSFYYTNIEIKSKIEKKIKFNNDILHQSKLVNYFNGDLTKSKIEKDLNNFLKKIKRNKKYFLSKKDQILITSLKSDGVIIDKKYDNLYESHLSEIPTDIQVMINNNEKGAVLLRIVEIIGQDELERMDDETVSFIIDTLNQLNIDFIRNKILLKVLPLKV